MSKYLVLLDTDRIHQYIYSSGTLKSIRGASSILAELNEKEAVKKLLESHNGEYIFAGGGQIMAKFNSGKEAEEFIRAEQTEYERHDASITGIKEEYIAGFDIVIKRAQFKLRRAKEEKAYVTHLLTNPFFKTCQLCGINPASKPKYDKFVCSACEKKMDRGKEIRDDPEESPIYAKFLNFARKQAAAQEWEGAKFAKDLSELGKLSKPENYLGLIYADGNRMGERLFKRTSKTEYQDLSKIIDNGLQESVFESVLKYIPKPSKKYLFSWDEITRNDKDRFIVFIEQECDIDWIREAKIEKIDEGKTIRVYTEERYLLLRINDEKNKINLKIDDGRTDEFIVNSENDKLSIYKRIIPFECVILGGDDLILLTPAQKAIPIALEILKSFEEKTKLFTNIIKEEKFTLSAGVVIAHSKFPISSFTKQAEDLLTSAKRINKEKWYGAENELQREDISTIDYLVISSPSANSVEVIRENELTYTLGKYKYRLTQRPFTFEKANRIVNIIKEIKRSKLSRSRLYSLHDALHRGKNQSILNILSLVTRLKGEEQENIKKLFTELRNNILLYPDGGALFPWNTGRVYDTPILDMLELYDFIEEEKPR